MECKRVHSAAESRAPVWPHQHGWSTLA